MNPRTFLPPSQQKLCEPPRFGERAPGLPLELTPGEPAVVVFLRHTGCPFAEVTVRRMRQAAEAHPGIQWVGVSHAPAPATARWCEEIGGTAGVLVISDPERAVYARWGLGRTDAAHFLGRRALSAVAAQARLGVRNRHSAGTRWQSAGAFAMDAAGIIRWRHIPAHAGDLPDLEQAAEDAVGVRRAPSGA